jgi:alanine dehydrogenase
MALIDRLDARFRAAGKMPSRHHHTIKEPLGRGSADATLLLMPAWTRNGGPARVGVKIVTVFPDNALRALPSVFGQYLLLDGNTGQSLALLDGTVLTKRRTACASGLASRYLSRPDSHRMLMIGTGALAPHLIRVHAKVRPIESVAIWGRRIERAQGLARELSAALPTALGRRIAVRAVIDRDEALAEADIVSCATLSAAPLIDGAQLHNGQHIDLVGAYTLAMREADDETLRRARIFVDTREGAMSEGGDVAVALAGGVIQPSDVLADLHELARREHAGRASGDVTSITLFKSVGAALEDLAAAELAVECTIVD